MRSVFGVSRDVDSILDRYMDPPTRDMIQRAFCGRTECPKDETVMHALRTKNNVCFYWYYKHFHEQLVDGNWAHAAAIFGNLPVLKHLKPYDARTMCRLAIQYEQLAVFKHFLPRVRPLNLSEWRSKCHNRSRFKRYIDLID